MLREQSGLVYSVESFVEAKKTRSAFGVFFACEPSNVAKARAMIERNLTDMQTTSITETELRQAKILLLRQLTLSEESMDGIVEGLLNLADDDLPLDEPIRAATEYREMTAKQVQDAFIKWIRPKDFVQITVGPAAQ